MFKKRFFTLLFLICLLLGLIWTWHHYTNHTSIQTKTINKNQETSQAIIKPTYRTDHNLLVVNKKHPLTQDYNPFKGTLDSNNPDGAGLSEKTNQAKEQIIADLQTAGFPISNQISGYRSYQYQTTLYNNYVANHGQKEADTFSARPGYSEHQSGLAFDLTGKDGQLPTDDKMYTWLQNNAYKYGLIIRFPRDSSAQTGYMGEEWHLRYIGINNSTKMHEEKISTLEEYTGIKGGDYYKDDSQDQPAVSE